MAASEPSRHGADSSNRRIPRSAVVGSIAIHILAVAVLFRAPSSLEALPPEEEPTTTPDWMGRDLQTLDLLEGDRPLSGDTRRQRRIAEDDTLTGLGDPGRHGCGDGWVSSQRDGRLSYYTLTPEGTARFSDATNLIYAPAMRQTPKRWRIALEPQADPMVPSLNGLALPALSLSPW